MISALYIFSLKGEILLQRVYASPEPPGHHLRALARTAISSRSFSEFAPVVCVGSPDCKPQAKGRSPLTSFCCFAAPSSCGSLATRSPCGPSSNTSGFGPTSTIVRGRAESRWGGSAGPEEIGVVYVAALRHNANVACILEVLRRLASLIQAYCTAALGASPSLRSDLSFGGFAASSRDGANTGIAGDEGSAADFGGARVGDRVGVKSGNTWGRSGALMGAVRRGLSAAGVNLSSAAVVDANFVRKHCVLLYELLDEVIDGGFPQLLDLSALKKFVTCTKGLHWPPDHTLGGGGKGATSDGAMGGTGGLVGFRGSQGRGELADIATSKQITRQVTGACSWRAPGLKYKRNEVFIDVVECVNVLISANGVVLRADVSGEVLVNCRLSGMPECKFGLNDRLPATQSGTVTQDGQRRTVLSGTSAPGPSTAASDSTRGGGDPAGLTLQQQGAGRSGGGTGGVLLDDCRFHQCVRLSKFDTERAITFVPPDGTFRLMNYRISEGISLPFKIFPLLQERSPTRMECVILLKALFEKNIAATNVEVVIPCPPSLCDLQLLHVGIGKAALDNTQQAVVWRIKKYPGAMEYLLRYELHLATQGGQRPVPQGSAHGGGNGTSSSAGGEGRSIASPAPHQLPSSRWKRPPLSLRFTIHMFTASGLCIRYLKIIEKSNYRTIKWIRYLTKAGTYQHRL
ncbi:adaptor complexes medium subunit family protein [Cystoisospora suis]|uniref:Adaptor complexes medium subunit family protein n=1 Tax=Cystoisospora suis TaxID=483139 RepID=A0A2C6KPA5_9APIC|nr:adaptor complexes medium subunit family protein [Cystoisospora suis]